MLPLGLLCNFCCVQIFILMKYIPLVWRCVRTHSWTHIICYGGIVLWPMCSLTYGVLRTMKIIYLSECTLNKYILTTRNFLATYSDWKGSQFTSFYVQLFKSDGSSGLMVLWDSKESLMQHLIYTVPEDKTYAYQKAT